MSTTPKNLIKAAEVSKPKDLKEIAEASSPKDLKGAEEISSSKDLTEAAEIFAQPPKPAAKSLQEKSVPNTLKITGTFLETFDLVQFRNSAKAAALACEAEMKRRKDLSEGLLKHVFNADPDKVAAFLNQASATQEMILEKNCCREGYETTIFDYDPKSFVYEGPKSLDACYKVKFVCLRFWKNVSALQAAALCLDKFLLIKLLARIVRDDKLRLEARKQLEEIRSRIVEENKDKHKQESLTAMGEKKELHEKVQDSSKGDGKEVHEKTHVSSKGDRKEAHEKTQDSSADQLEYGASIKAFLEAHAEFRSKRLLLIKQENWEELNKLWDIVGSLYKRLPRYILQEIFKDKHWGKDTEFSLEPPRGELRDSKGCLLNLDLIGDGTGNGLFKGPLSQVQVRNEIPPWWDPKTDSDAISKLYKIRLADLIHIIDMLESPETALALVASELETQKLRPSS